MSSDTGDIVPLQTMDESIAVDGVDTQPVATYTTSRGYVVEFLAVPNLLAKLASQFPAPTPPTYEVKTAGGPTETHTHNETTLETDADKEAWRAYEHNVALHAANFWNAQVKLSLLRGIKVLNADDEKLKTWADEQTLIGFEVPTNDSERRLHWLQTEVAASNEDLIMIVAGVSRQTGIPEEAVLQLEQSFRGAVGRARRKVDNGIKDASNGKGVVHPEPIRGSGRSVEKRRSKHYPVGRDVAGR